MSTPENNIPDMSYDKTNNDNNSGDSFVENNNFQVDEEKEKAHMLSFQDVQILQNQLRQIFQKGKTDNINFAQFCEIIQNMVPSPETNDSIKSIYNDLDVDNNGTIAYESFLQTNVFHKFLKTIGFIILNKSKTITNEELENEIDKMHDKFYFRALSIHNTHDREIILSEAETIQKLKHWINVYGKPSQLKCQYLQCELENNIIMIHTLKRENDELTLELSQIKQENEQFQLDSQLLQERGNSLQQQVSLVKEEQKQYLVYSENKHVELNTLQMKYQQSVTTQNDLIAENDKLKQTTLQNVDENAYIKKQSREKVLYIKSLEIDKENLSQKMQELNKLIEQQQVDINLLESENAEQMQEIELLQSKTYSNANDIGLNFRTTEIVYPTVHNGINDIDGILDITSTDINMEDEILNVTREADEDEMEFKSFSQKSLDSGNDNFYRIQINELKQQLLDEQRKREELEMEIQLKMEQELKDSMIRRRSRSNSNININVNLSHDRLSIDSIPLTIKEKNDDLSSADEYQPFISDKSQNKQETSSVQKDKVPKCCSFLFGM